MASVALLLTDPVRRRLAVDQIGSRAAIRFCASIEGLADAIGAGGVDAAVVDPLASGAGLLPSLGTIRRGHRYLPIVLFTLPTPALLRELADVVALGGRLELVLQGTDHLGLALDSLLRPLRVPGPSETLARHLVPVVPPPFRPFLAIGALKASPHLRVDAAARLAGASRRSLERGLHQAGLPSAASVLGSCTALHAAWWLDIQGWSAKHVAAEMGFSHRTALIRLLQRHFGVTVRSLDDHGGFQGLLYRFETALLRKTA
jgi:AraC-like DNA-binding protein